LGDIDGLNTLLSSYIEARTTYLTQQAGVFFTPNSTKELTSFDRMVNSHHQMVANLLPPMNLAELEALAELINSRLAFIRMHKLPGQ
jgi:hypothetical protein